MMSLRLRDMFVEDDEKSGQGSGIFKSQTSVVGFLSGTKFVLLRKQSRTKSSELGFGHAPLRSRYYPKDRSVSGLTPPSIYVRPK